MKLEEAIKQCEDFDEFFIHYRKLRGKKGTSYLQGTTNLDDRYIQSVIAKNPNCQRLLREGPPKGEPSILVFSRSSNYLRYIPASHIVRITSLNAELDRSEKDRDRQRKS